MKSRMKIILPALVIVLGVLGAVGMILARPEVSTSPPEAQPPLIRVFNARAEDIVLRVRTQGTVEPRTESSLIPEVSGRVVWASPALAAGGFFEADEPLLRVERRDYEVAVERHRAALAQRESEARLAEANLSRARSLSDSGVTSKAELDQAENASRVTAAGIREARAALQQAETDLGRTELRAPFAGRVRQEQVDLGQFIVRGAPVATLYAVDYAEIRLPVPDDQLAFLDLPLAYRGDGSPGAGHEVRLTARFAGADHTWQGHVVRTEGEIDPRSRMVTIVARVDDPYGRSEPGRPPLAVGLFVQAEILGHSITGAIVLPRQAVRDADKVLIVDADDRLRFRQVEPLRADGEIVVLRSGVSPGERVCISPLEAVADGMKVRLVDDEDTQDKDTQGKGRV